MTGIYLLCGKNLALSFDEAHGFIEEKIQRHCKTDKNGKGLATDGLEGYLHFKIPELQINVTSIPVHIDS